GSVIGFYQALVPLRIEHVPVVLENLPAEAEGMRIAVMTDLHVGLFTRPSRLEKIFNVARALNPDVAMILGDMIDDDPYYLPKLLDGTTALGPDIPLLAVLGNHEIYGDPRRVIEGLRGSRIRLLVNEQLSLRSIVFAGLGEYAVNRAPEHRALGPDIAKATAGAAFPIVLSHQPKAFYEARAKGIPLTLAGHTHGGQCGIRPLGWSLAGVFLEYHMGLYRQGTSHLYINTGTGFWFVPFRLGMTPEITLIELRRAS
ncbi:MAG: metallophosphoesterase, partial [Thermoanaerobaculia bacterium]